MTILSPSCHSLLTHQTSSAMFGGYQADQGSRVWGRWQDVPVLVLHDTGRSRRRNRNKYQISVFYWELMEIKHILGAAARYNFQETFFTTTLPLSLVLLPWLPDNPDSYQWSCCLVNIWWPWHWYVWILIVRVVIMNTSHNWHINQI